MDDEEKGQAESGKKSYLFFHKRIRRFRVGKFEFKKNYLRIDNDEDRDAFLAILNDPKFPKRDALQIVEINEEARAATETSVIQKPTTSPVVRGPMNAADILTAKDQQRLQNLSKPGQNGGNLAPNLGAGSKPSGVDISKINLGNGDK
jgi:hypothetical protein